MSLDARLFGIWIGAALAVFVILAAFGAALVIYQRRFLALHRDYSKKLIAAHEEERAYVAREVHDDALQRVAMLQHELRDWVDDQTLDTTAERARSDALRQELEDLGVMLRRVAHRLHPAIIEQGGLVPALAQLADDTSRATRIDVQTKLPAPGSDRGLGRDRVLMLFRIAQEALRNVSKHSGASTAEVALEVQPGSLTMRIADNGRGFQAVEPTRSTGLGLISMTERARLVDGHINIWSAPGKGTTIRVHVPIRG